MDRKNPHQSIHAGGLFGFRRTVQSAAQSSGSRADSRIVCLAIDFALKSYQRINLCVDRMFADGFIDEARSLLPYRDTQRASNVGLQLTLRTLRRCDGPANDRGAHQTAHAELREKAVDLVTPGSELGMGSS